MASIFTYDPDPPRVASPWPAAARGRACPASSREPFPTSELGGSSVVSAEAAASQLQADGVVAITRLEAEPQEGPTEYKLHLLLRPRRSFTAVSTGRHVSGSQHSKSTSSTPRGDLEPSQASFPPLSQSAGSRQHRLEQLTTQLLWRLQQSSPHHSSSTTNLILPSLPEATPELRAPRRPAKLVPGLEESKGALYEIGVSDDGTFVGLTVDEMNESLNNLRAMAASLGCSVSVLRMVPVGDCEWLADADHGRNGGPVVQKDKLYVAEAYVKPEFQSQGDDDALLEFRDLSHVPPTSQLGEDVLQSVARVSSSLPEKDQVRISLTGATASGKSSLLGTLSTSTLDNARGKSRLSLLKHRHEIASGVTSSVAQELIGYSEPGTQLGGSSRTQIINYATANVSSWNDIHASTASGRVAFISDSAGHPRYLRTTVRGLVGWSPHWTLLCVAANDGAVGASADEHGPARMEEPDSPGGNAHLSMAHLDLCLTLDLHLVVVVTKLDMAIKSNIRQILSMLLTKIKSANRKPIVLSSDGQTVTEADLQAISRADDAEVEKLMPNLETDPHGVVPIVFTSAVKGFGIGKIHSLLHKLPVYRVTVADDAPQLKSNCTEETPEVLYFIEDVFSLPVSKAGESGQLISSNLSGSVIGGYVARGRIAVGDELLIGPFSDITATGEHSDNNSTAAFEDSFLSPRSFSDALAKATSSPKIPAISPTQEWRRVEVVSIRNLRLPVRALESDRVGTIGIIPTGDNAHQPLPIRKGMILASGDPSASHTLTATFDAEHASSVVVGSHVVLYCASVRASAKVVAVALENHDPSKSRIHSPERQGRRLSEDAFEFEMDEDLDEREGERPLYTREAILVTFQFATRREWIEQGSKVLILPGGGTSLNVGSDRSMKGGGLGGFDGFVGRVVECFS